jgi:hypothetical protein
MRPPDVAQAAVPAPRKSPGTQNQQADSAQQQKANDTGEYFAFK